MLRLRHYKREDAATILSWIRDEDAFRKWSADRYDHYPITPEDMNDKYLSCNGDCPEPDNFYPMTAWDERGIAGHLILRYTDPEKRIIRLGFVIVDVSRRRTGCGREMFALALRYAFEFLKAEKVTLGVLEDNPVAYKFYRNVGFRDVTPPEPEYYQLMGKRIQCLELEMERNAWREGAPID